MRRIAFYFRPNYYKTDELGNSIGYVDDKKHIVYYNTDENGKRIKWRVTDLNTGLCLMYKGKTRKECQERIEQIWPEIERFRETEKYKKQVKAFNAAILAAKDGLKTTLLILNFQTRPELLEKHKPELAFRTVALIVHGPDAYLRDIEDSFASYYETANYRVTDIDTIVKEVMDASGYEWEYVANGIITGCDYMYNIYI